MIEKTVYEYLEKHHIGKDKMIKNKTLRSMFGIKSDKAMRKVIQNIREDINFTKVVGSVSGKSGGFYICNSEEEIEETINNIRHRAGQMYRMCCVLEYKLQKQRS